MTARREEKPDGWACWHPKKGWLKKLLGNTPVQYSEDAAWYQLQTSYPVIREKLSARGWRIRPVKLVFLDEEDPTA